MISKKINDIAHYLQPSVINNNKVEPIDQQLEEPLKREELKPQREEQDRGDSSELNKSLSLKEKEMPPLRKNQSLL